MEIKASIGEIDDELLSQGERIKWFVANYYETGMDLEILLVSMRNVDLDNFIWYGEKIDIPKKLIRSL